MQRPEEEVITTLTRNGVDFTASLPCEKIKTLLEMVGRSFQHLPLTREEEGVGICAGAALAGRRPAMFVQSSGIGNMINALLSLTQFYELPLALFVSRRGVYQEKIEAQFPMGRKLPAMLAGAGITYTEINAHDELSALERELPHLYEKNKIHAFLMSPKVWEGSECRVQSADSRAQKGECEVKYVKIEGSHMPAPLLTRYDIIKIVAPYLEGKVVVSNLGWPSKELYAIKNQPSNFYMLGSMGMVTPIGLGIALSSHKEVVVIDGDGSLLMNPGTLATAASAAPENLTIVAIDNGAYGSTGNQPTLAASCVDLEQVARGFGFRNTVKVVAEQEIIEAMKGRRKGPSFIHVLALPGNKDVPNIPVHHLEIKKQVQGFLKT
ncbi:MAG: Sulfopyruvate decarboxylase - alpha subunit [Nitrospirae bacterium]|nr:Sulfopyruvate decarboxylase - alpha subunit [Nitrospirota bacterium]